MPTNIEIKAVVADLAALRERVLPLATGEPVILDQHDVFFNAPRGRLKLRTFDATHGELIAYVRPDATEPQASHYQISPTSEPAALRALLAGALGEIGTVIKRRELLLIGPTRVHLDTVQGLGTCMELEVVLGAGGSEAAGTEVAQTLLEQLQIAPEDLRRESYLDLLMAKAKTKTKTKTKD